MSCLRQDSSLHVQHTVHVHVYMCVVCMHTIIQCTCTCSYGSVATDIDTTQYERCTLNLMYCTCTFYTYIYMYCTHTVHDVRCRVPLSVFHKLPIVPSTWHPPAESAFLEAARPWPSPPVPLSEGREGERDSICFHGKQW